MRTLAVIYQEQPSVLVARLVSWGVLNGGAAAAMQRSGFESV
jgi:hypothetical protein